MISTLFKKKNTRLAAPKNPHVPGDTVVWAIGDVHGRLDLLKPLVEAIRSELLASTFVHRTVIFLGDYVDRGPDSRGVIQYLSNLSEDDGIRWCFLRGNHEQAMLDFIRDPSQGATWCEYGGDMTLRSYGLHPPQMRHKLEAWAHVSADLSHKLSDRERAFLEGLELSVAVGDYFFAHAGARPGESLDRQTAADLMWIRRSFLESDWQFDRIVVHGHTPAVDAYSDHRRIGIDTRAYESGLLTALKLVGSEQHLLQSTVPSSGVAQGGPVALIRRQLFPLSRAEAGVG